MAPVYHLPMRARSVAGRHTSQLVCATMFIDTEASMIGLRTRNTFYTVSTGYHKIYDIIVPKPRLTRNQVVITNLEMYSAL